jgi:hypothetical protein
MVNGISEPNDGQNNGVISDNFPGGEQQTPPPEPQLPEGLFINICNWYFFDFYQIFSTDARRNGYAL